MKIVKIILLCTIPALGIFAMNKIQFGEKLVIMLPGKAPVRRPGGPQGAPPQMEQGAMQAPRAEGEHGRRQGPQQEQGNVQHFQADGEHGRSPGPELEQGGHPESRAEGERLSQGRPPRPAGEEQSKWKTRINFNRGIKNIGYLTLILAFLVELTYLADRLIRKKSLL